jgi:hypothetical protein
MRGEHFSLVWQPELSWSGLPHLPPRTVTTSIMLTPDVLLPEQSVNHPCSSGRGETALMRAVLADAFLCFTKQFASNRPRTRRLAREAEEWFFSEDEYWPFSFINICAALRIDPAYVRRGLTQRRQQHRR